MKNMLLKNKFIYLGGVLLLATLALGGLYFKQANAEEAFHCPSSLETEEEEEIEQLDDKTMQIDIKGAVRNPGVYEIEEGSVVNDIIKLAGGLLSNADTRSLNLSKKLKDEMVIYVYTTDEVKDQLALSDANIIDDLNNDKTIIDDEDDIEALDEKVSLNNGTLEQLIALPGIGEAKAKSIIEYRKTCGGFQKLEDIKNISGIGDAVYQKLKDYITL